MSFIKYTRDFMERIRGTQAHFALNVQQQEACSALAKLQVVGRQVALPRRHEVLLNPYTYPYSFPHPQYSYPPHDPISPPLSISPPFSTYSQPPAWLAAQDRGHITQPFAIVSGAKIWVHSHKHALNLAASACAQPESPSSLVYWTDASHSKDKFSSVSYAVAYKRDGLWETFWNGDTNIRQTTNTAELMSIGFALHQAVMETSKGSPGCAPERVRIFTDSKRALEHIRNPPQVEFPHSGLNSETVRAMVLSSLHLLEQAGIEVDLNWVPRGQVEGNIMADWFAGETRVLAQIRAGTIDPLFWVPTNPPFPIRSYPQVHDQPYGISVA